ncbi:type II toxin-antitoxin system PemK/MazF family toxin [Gloeothece verrucosa]|uniref:Transcriptional modulator of MazE/toxin, MazF n=1 Tax=Gloeothece verrucosa (strain PCC 7822) TaxID=497965 RepID=E0UE86_GLOV7|nr:type II toxin-antitoxin system PemK/MazF family toxin [Gloeothece verrucosa]ADN14211.1 transcriptional modulator of MazE/toxin, MazF [Gloeothece verrucosa PCC 7822]
MVKIDGSIPCRGDIIRLSLNPRTGSEQSGIRPALVISPQAYNRVSKIILICPITSKEKGWPFEVKLPDSCQVQGVVLVDQLRAVDCQARNANFIEKISMETLNEIMARLESLVT